MPHLASGLIIRVGKYAILRSMPADPELDACCLHDDGTPDMATEHGGEPVTSGYRIIFTKGFRARGDRPVFHE